MIVSGQHDPLGQCYRVQITFSEKDAVVLAGNLTELVVRTFEKKILDYIDPEKLVLEVKKGVIENICKQIADKFIEENGEEILDDAREALEDMVENMT